MLRYLVVSIQKSRESRHIEAGQQIRVVAGWNGGRRGFVKESRENNFFVVDLLTYGEHLVHLDELEAVT